MAGTICDLHAPIGVIMYSKRSNTRRGAVSGRTKRRVFPSIHSLKHIPRWQGISSRLTEVDALFKGQLVFVGFLLLSTRKGRPETLSLRQVVKWEGVECQISQLRLVNLHLHKGYVIIPSILKKSGYLIFPSYPCL